MTGQTAKPKGRRLRLLRTLHGWLGILIFPWVILIGATGFYLNHPKTILAALDGPGYAESRFDAWPGQRPVTEATARTVAGSVWPGEPVQEVKDVTYHDRPAFEVAMPAGKVIVTRPTGHYFVETSYTRRFHSPDGRLLDRKIVWGAVAERLHMQGWADWKLGALHLNLAAMALLLLGLAGVLRWRLPRSLRPMRPASRTG